MAMTDKLTSQESMGMVASLENVYKNVPFHLPAGVIDFIVNIAPYLAIIGAVLGLLVGPLAAIGTVFSLLTFDIRIVGTLVVSLVILGINTVLSLMAFKPLKERQMKGWMLVFWMEMLSVVTLVTNLIFQGGSGLVSSLLGLVIGFYILFEIKPRYT